MFTKLPKMIIGIDGNEANEKNRVGIGQFAFNILSCLEKIDSKNSYFIYLKEPPLNDLPKERAGWQYKVVGPKKFWTQLGLPLKLFGQKEKLDVFYSPSHYAPRFSPMPTIISIMDLWHHRHPEQFDKKDLYRLLNWEKYSVKNSSRIVTISEFTKSEIVKFYNYPAKRITVAYPGYTKLKIKNEKLKIEEIKRKFGIKGNYLLYLGTLQPKKNIVGLVSSLNILISQYPHPEGIPRRENITLVIAGKKGWLYEEIFNKIKDLGLEEKVIFTDFVAEEEKPYLIAGAKCFVLPSFYEGFGIPVLEAMSLGVPVITSNAASMPEVGGEAAFYCDPKSPRDIAQAMRKVLGLKKSQRDEIIAKSRQQAKKFSWENCCQKVLAALENVKK